MLLVDKMQGHLSVFLLVVVYLSLLRHMFCLSQAYVIRAVVFVGILVSRPLCACPAVMAGLLG